MSSSAYLDIASWQPLGDHQYRQVKVYDTMRWGDAEDGVDLASCLVVAAPFGGPIAVTRDSSKMTSFRAGAETITLYSSAGEQVSAMLFLVERARCLTPSLSSHASSPPCAALATSTLATPHCSLPPSP